MSKSSNHRGDGCPDPKRLVGSNQTAQNISQAWLSAIDDSTALLRGEKETFKNSVATTRYVGLLDHSLSYLETIYPLLVEKVQTDDFSDSKWNHLPWKPPPPFQPISLAANTNDTKRSNSCIYMQNNPYSQLFGDDPDTDEEEAGDRIVPFWNQKDLLTNNHGDSCGANCDKNSLDIRRLTIRLYTAQSDLLVFRSLAIARWQGSQQWLAGAQGFAKALERNRLALKLADAKQSVRVPGTHESCCALAQDADIIQVSTQWLIKQRDRYFHAAKSRLRWLESKIESHRKQRAQAKQRMGTERWINNPRRKMHFVNHLKHQQEEVRRLQLALDYLQKFANTEILHEATKTTLARLKATKCSGGSKALSQPGKRLLRHGWQRSGQGFRANEDGLTLSLWFTEALRTSRSESSEETIVRGQKSNEEQKEREIVESW